MALLNAVLISLMMLSGIQAIPGSSEPISLEYRGFEDDRYIFVTDCRMADSIGIIFNKQKEIKSYKDLENQSFRIRFSSLREGLHSLKINCYSKNVFIGKRDYSFFKEDGRIIFLKNYLWISRFDFAHMVNKNKLKDQKEYNQEIQKVLSGIVINAASSGITDIIFQARGNGDVLYKSKIEPFSHLLSLNSIIGEDPGWDPLDFMIDLCRRHNLNIHVWINVFPIEHSGRKKLQKANGIELPINILRNLAAEDNRGNLPSAGGYTFLHPAHSGVYEYILTIIDELLSNYEFDGIHFDYFRLDDKKYIYNRELAKKYSLLGIKVGYEDFIRNRINMHLKGLYDYIKSRAGDIIVSCAVIGKLRGNGFSAVNHFQDPVLWIEKDMVDLIFPMTYFYPQSIGHIKDYATEIKLNNHCRIIPGIGAYLTLKREKNHPFSYISDSYGAILKEGEFGGAAFFNGESLEANSFWNSLRSLLLDN